MSKTKTTLIDLFCGVGGASTGYRQAGFDEVVGVDIEHQSRYPYRFVQGDALRFLDKLIADEDGDWIEPDSLTVFHASPPCQAHSGLNRHNQNTMSPMLIDKVRDRFTTLAERWQIAWVIENVVGARRFLRSPIKLHGGMFGLRVYRPRFFECNLPLDQPPKARRPTDVVAVYGRYADQRRIKTRVDGSILYAASLADAQTAMEMPWADWDGIREAIPPAYTRWVGEQVLSRLSQPVKRQDSLQLMCDACCVMLYFDADSETYLCPQCFYSVKVLQPNRAYL